MKIAESETRSKYPLSHKKILKKTLESSLVSVIGLLIIFGVLLFTILNINSEVQNLLAYLVTIVTLILIILSTSLSYFYQKWYFSVYFYDLTEDFIIIKKGPITPREITIPYERVQDVYVDQDILDRLFNIYDVHLSSATISSGMEAHIDGVEKEAADGLRKVLLDTVSSKIHSNRNGK